MVPPNQGGQADNSMGYFWILIGIFIAVVAIWYFAHDYIVYFYLHLKSLEISVINVFTDRLRPVQRWIQLVPIQQVSFSKLATAADLVGGYLSVPIAIVLGVLAIVIYRSNPARKFRRTHNMKTLMQQETHNWPTIKPISKLDLVNKDLLDGPWSMALTPMEFAKKNKLIRLETLPIKEGQLKREEETVARLLHGRANKLLTLQLGKPFTDVDKLPVHVQALFGIFAARANRDRKGADKLMKQIAASSADGKLNFTGAKELAKKHSKSKITRLVTDKHAYVLTMMASMLDLARIDGVLASAEFLWLKPIDRHLWYMLCNVGRQTAFTEVAGPFAHWLAERELGQKIITPMIDEATNALEMALDELVYVPDDDEDVVIDNDGSSKNKGKAA